MVLLLIGGCGSNKSTTYAESTFVGTWTGTDTETNTTVTVDIALANPANPDGPTTASVNLSVPNPDAPGGLFTTMLPVVIPRYQLDPTEYYFYIPSSPAGGNYSFVMYVSPILTTGSVNFRYSIMSPPPNNQTPFVGPISISLTRTSST